MEMTEGTVRAVGELGGTGTGPFGKRSLAFDPELGTQEEAVNGNA